MHHGEMPTCEANIHFSTSAANKGKMPEILQRGLLLDVFVFHPNKIIFSPPSFLSCPLLCAALILISTAK